MGLLICIRCKREMRPIRLGFGARFGETHYYAGDVWSCGSCGFEAVVTAAQPYEDKTGRPGVKMEESDDRE